MTLKRWQKLTIGVAAVLAVCVVILAATNRLTFSIMMGAGGIGGAVGEIPEAVKELPPVNRGKADWPRWRGALGDGKSTVRGIRKDWSGGLKTLWEVDYLCHGDDSGAWSAPAIQGNRMVISGRDVDADLVFCLDSETGALFWHKSYAAKAKKDHGRGPRATACIDDGRVYTFGRSGDLVCWGLLDGEKLWHENVAELGGEAPKWGHSSSPIVRGDVVLVQGGGEALVIAYDKMTGEVKWKSMKGPAGYAPVVEASPGRRNELLVFHGKGLSGLDPESGAERWGLKWKTNYGVNATTPIVDGSKVFITSGYNTGCELIKVMRDGAEVLWKNKAIASHHSDPYIIDGHIFGYSGNSWQNKGDFRCVDLATGQMKWSTGEIGWGTCVRVDGHLLCVDIKGNAFLVKPNASEFRKVTELRGALGDIEGPVWTLPVIANGKLYLRFKQHLVCYDLLKK